MIHASMRGAFFVSAATLILLGLAYTQGTVLYAATLYIEPNDTSLYRGDTITLAVRVDTREDECINTVDAVIEYGEAVQAVDVSRGNSILSLWVEEPVIDTENRRITFAGGIPNGYCGRVPGDPRLTNIVTELVFRAPGFTVGPRNNETYATIHFGEETQVLLNDGFGTRAEPLGKIGARINLYEGAGTSTSDSWRNRVQADERPPERFSVTLVKDASAFSGRYYIVFSTTDKGSGLDHYEVIEEPLSDLGLFKWGGISAPWHEVKSPYVLEDQTLNSTIRVKAVDKSGNEYIAVLIPDESLRSAPQGMYLQYLILGLSIMTIVIVGGVAFVVIRRWRRINGIVEEGHE